jgi:hypothetical protein
MYTPRIDENGRDCCTRVTPHGTKAYGLRVGGTLRACSACQAHHAAIWRAMQADLRTAAPELRTKGAPILFPEEKTMTETDLTRAVGLELRRRDQGFMLGSVDLDALTYEAWEDGKTKTKKFAFKLVDGVVVVTSPRFTPPQEAVTHLEEFSSGDIYAEGVRRLRLAAATPASDFEDRWKADRLRATYATRSALDAEEPGPRLTAAELADYRAPDPYRDGIRKLQENNR